MIVGHHRLTDELFPAAAIFCSPYLPALIPLCSFKYLLYSTNIVGLLICLPYMLVDGAVVEASLVVPVLSFFNAVVSPPFGDVGLRASVCFVSLKPTFYLTGYCGLLPHSLTGPPWLYADYVTCTQPRLVFEISMCRQRYR